MPAAASTWEIALDGNSGSCFLRVKRSSSTAATSWPSRRRAAAASWKKQEIPRMYIPASVLPAGRRQRVLRRRPLRPEPGSAVRDGPEPPAQQSRADREGWRYEEIHDEQEQPRLQVSDGASDEGPSGPHPY